MKILFANYRYFVSGGPERYMFNLSDELAARGHQIVPFSIRYKLNRSSPYEDYFVEPLGSEDQVYFRDQNRSVKTVHKTLTRLFYAKDVENAVTRLIKDTEPQVAYVLHYLRKLSPALLVGLHKAGLPVIVRISDYGMVCPQAHCLRDAQPCELCVQGSLIPSIRNKCVQNSFSASAINACATWFHRYKKNFDLIDSFVTTNQFMSRMLIKAGISPDRISIIPTFVDTNVFYPDRKKATCTPYAVYIGRLEDVKGLHILLGAWGEFINKNQGSCLKLKIIGKGNVDYTNRLKQLCLDLKLVNVEFLGEVGCDEASKLLRHSIMSVIPSLWYENLPNSLLESFASGIPVLASNIGSLRDCVEDGETGFLFEPGNSSHLADRMDYCYKNPDKMAVMSKQVRQVAKEQYSPEKHILDLLALFSASKEKWK